MDRPTSILLVNFTTMMPWSVSTKDSDDLAEMYVHKVRKEGGAALKTLKQNRKVVELLIKCMDEGWTTSGERLTGALAERFLRQVPHARLWNIYGLGLPDEVLRKIYHENAVRIIPGLRDKLAKARRALPAG